MHPVDTGDYLAFPSTRMTQLKDSCFVQSDGRHYLATGVLDDGDGSAWHVGVHEEVSLVEVALDEHFVLLGVLACDDEVVLGGDEPIELLKPKDLAHSVHLLRLPMLGDLFHGMRFCVSHCNISCILSFEFLLIALLLDFEVLLDVHLRRYVQVDVHSDYWIEVGELLVQRKLVTVNVLLIACVQQKRDVVLLEVDLLYEVGQGVARLLLFLDHARDIVPGDARGLHDLQDVNDGLGFVDILLKELGFELGEVLLFLEALDALFLVVFDATHFLPDFVFFARVLGLLSLLV